jgi:8-oxo-dGTP pyrophosphatase MutT (NUDIX family)
MFVTAGKTATMTAGKTAFYTTIFFVSAFFAMLVNLILSCAILCFPNEAPAQKSFFIQHYRVIGLFCGVTLLTVLSAPSHLKVRDLGLWPSTTTLVNTRLVEPNASQYPRGAAGSARDEIEGPSLYSVIGFLVTLDGKVLLARRGPASNPPDQRGLFAAIGGKREHPETADECLIREVAEEVGYDIKTCPRMPIATAVKPEYSLLSFVVAVPEFEPIIKPAETDKLVEPQWFTSETLPISEMSAATAENAKLSLSVSQRLFSPRAALPGNGKTAWIDRNTSALPAGFDVIKINNKDSLCCFYAATPQLQEKDRRSIDWARTNVPEDGFAPYDFVPLSYKVDVWNTNQAAWSHGDGRITAGKVFLAYTTNGSGGHYDAMRPSTDPTAPVDAEIYPQGRASEEEQPEEIEDPIEEQKETKDDEDIADDTSELSMTQTEMDRLEAEIEEDDRKVPLASEIHPRTLTVGAGSYIQHVRKAGASAAQSPELFYNWINKILLIAKETIITSITFSDRAKFFINLEHKFVASYESATNGLTSFIEFLRDNSIDDMAHTDMHFPYGQITSYLTNEVGNSQHQVAIKMKTAYPKTFHSLTLRPNLRPYSVPEAPHKQAQDLQALFPLIFDRGQGNNCAVNVGRYLNSSDDFGSDGMAYIFERLVSGALAATTGCYASVCRADQFDYPDIAVDAWDKNVYVPDAGILFPVHDLTCRHIFEGVVTVNQLPAGLRGANCHPNKWFNPLNPGTSGATTLFNTNITGFHSFPSVIRGNSAPNRTQVARDFRVVLANYHTPKMGLSAPLRFRNANNTTAPHNESVFLRPHDFAVPPLTLISSASLPDQLGTNEHNAGLARNPAGANASAGLQPSALANPQSWFDAIGFLLHHFGGRDAFAIGCQNAFRRSGVFGPSAFQELAIQYGGKYDTPAGADDILVLTRRLAAMRVRRPHLQDGLTAQNNSTFLSFARLMLAVQTAGPNCESHLARTVTAVGHAQALAAVQRVFPRITPANLRFGFEDDQTIVINADWSGHIRDAAWHQFFASIDLSTSQEPLEIFVSSMTSDEQSSMRAWLLDTNFVDRWDPATHTGEAGRTRLDTQGAHWSITVLLPNGLPMVTEDDALYVAQALRHNADTRGTWNLPVLNIIESAQVTVPSGLSMLRSLRISHDMYHSDNAALVLAEEFWRMSPQHFLEKFVKYNLALRSAADVTTHSLGITAGLLMERQGNYCTGNNQLDDILYESSSRSQLGGMNNLIHTYVQEVTDLILGQGISTSLCADFTTGYTKIQFMDYTNFTDWQPTGGRGATKPETFWLWRALHPLTIACFIPQALTAPTNISPDADILTTITSRKQLPWSDWVIPASTMTPFEAFASLRGLLATVGYRVPLKLTITYGEEISAPDPTVYDVAPWITDMPLRRSDAYPHAPTAMVDPLVAFRFQYSVFITGIRNANDRYEYIKPTHNFSFLRHVRTTDLPPTLPWHNIRNTSGTNNTTAAILHDDLFDTDAGAKFPAEAPWYAGQHYSGRSNISTSSFAVGPYQRLQQLWHSNQESGNVVRTRSFGAFLNQYSARAVGNWAPSLDITDSAGRLLSTKTTNRGAGNLTSHADIKARDSIFTYVPVRDVVPMDDYGLRGAYVAAVNQAIAFVGTIRYKVFISKPIFILGKYASQPLAEHSGIYQPFSSGATALTQAKAALGSIEEIRIPKADKQIQAKEFQFTGSEIVQAPADTYDMRHFMPAIPLGASALDFGTTENPTERRTAPPMRTSNLDGFTEVIGKHMSGDSDLDTLRNTRLHTYNQVLDEAEQERGRAAKEEADAKKAAAREKLENARARKTHRAAVLALEAQLAKLKKEQPPAGANALMYRTRRSTSPIRTITHREKNSTVSRAGTLFMPDF